MAALGTELGGEQLGLSLYVNGGRERLYISFPIRSTTNDCRSVCIIRVASGGIVIASAARSTK